VLFHDRSSRGALAYLALAGEVLRREDERESITQTGRRLATIRGAAQESEVVSRET
jgi:hypothetical protein